MPARTPRASLHTMLFPRGNAGARERPVRCWTINAWLGGLVLACILPAAAVAAFLIAQSHERERATLSGATLALSRALIQAVDSELIGAEEVLEALATSPHLASGDLAAFDAQARQALGPESGNNIALSDASGQQLVNTASAFGAPLPRHGNPAQLQRVLTTGRPVISDLFMGGLLRRPLVVVEVPVFAGGRAVAGLAMGFLPERLSEVLRRQRIPTDVVAAIFDSNGTIVARTQAAEEFVGRQGPAELIRRIAEVPEDTIEAVTLDGIPVVLSFSRSAISGWTLAIGTPTATFTAALRRSLLIDAAAAFAALLLGAAVARAIGGRVAHALRALRGPAMALGGTEPIAVPATPIAEVNELGRALAQAQQLIAQRVTERDRAVIAEHRMDVEKRAADEANRTKSEFLAMMSHELRTPMNGVLGFAQLLGGEHFGPLSTKQKEFVDHILASGHHLLELINDILDLSKIESGRLAVSLERVDLLPLVSSVMATLAQPAEKAGIALDAGDCGAGMPPVRADRVRLAQALLNLGSNAIKYNRPSGTVTLGTERLGDDRVRITVSDTGVGIPAQRQGEIFQPFNRLGAEQRGTEGTGIGLALTRRLVGLMGGEVGFASTEGVGSRFWIDIPVHVASAAPTGVAAVAPSDAGGLAAAAFSVLYIEDNPANRALVRNVLATLKQVRLREAPDAASGLALARAVPPDIVVVDVNLPDLDGYAVLRALRQLPALAATPVLALSANALPRDISRGMQAGFFRYLTKPLDVNAFLGALEAALARNAPDAPGARPA
jgi:signal transduction histidine kinase/ActR/RegA family two-component response regulator